HVTLLHHLFALMQITGEDAMPVIEHRVVSFEEELADQRNDRVGRRVDLTALARRNIDAKMRRGRCAVENALATEQSADDSVRGPIERFGESCYVAVGFARGSNEGV